MMNISTIAILSIGAAILTSCEQSKDLYYLSRLDVQAAQESYLVAGGNLIVEQGAELEGPFAEGPGVAGGTFGSISLHAGDKKIKCEPEPGHRVEAWSYLMEDGRAWVVARQFPIPLNE